MTKALTISDVAPLLADEAKAQSFMRDLRWPDGVVCPFCEGATVGNPRVSQLKGYTPKPRKDGSASPAAPRLQWKCARCRTKFSVTSRSIFEASHVKAGHWIFAIFMMAGSKKGISSNQLMRELGLSYKSAWFVTHRVREAMKQEPMASLLGKDGAFVELDETLVGGIVGNNLHRNKGPKAGKKNIVMTLIERDGDVKSVHVPDLKKRTLQGTAKPIVDRSATIVTDAYHSYEGLDQHFHAHHVVDHSKTFVRGVIHTNFAESFHSLLKRGILGSFHHVSDKHLHRYLSEFDRRWNTRKLTDGERAIGIMRSASGKRLKYRKGPNSLI